MNLPALAQSPIVAAPGESLVVIDSHTAGQPTRVVVAGTGIGAGTDPQAAREMLARERDWVRRLAVFEPRGHRSMFGVVLIEPAAPDQPWGFVYMDANGYPDMCGHATIGAATTLFAAGLVPGGGADFSGARDIPVRTPLGAVELTASFQAGRCSAVAFRLPLAYCLGTVELMLPGGDTCPVDIAWAGQWYAFLPASVSQSAILPEHIDTLIAAAIPVRALLAAQCRLVDPVTGLVPQIGNIVWTDAADGAEADARNVPISSAGSFDRSPCGTATCARMAILAAKGQLEIGETFVNQGLVGTLYAGRLLRGCAVPGVHGFVPQVQGSAWLTAQATLWRDPHDPLGEGFLV